MHPIEVEYDSFKLGFNIDNFNPALLEKRGDAESNLLRSAILRVMKKIAMLSNQNLLRNANAYKAQGGEIDKEMKF